MRKLLLFPILLALCLIASCNKGSTSSGTEVDSLAQFRDTVVGNFNGSQIDTLICEPIDAPCTAPGLEGLHYEWKVYSKNGTVSSLIVDNTIGINFYNMGDLDFDGADEWGFITKLPTSTWMSFRVFTYKNGYDRELYEPQAIWLSHIDVRDTTYYSGLHPKRIATAYRPDSIKVKYSDLINDGEDFVALDTILPILK